MAGGGDGGGGKQHRGHGGGQLGQEDPHEPGDAQALRAFESVAEQAQSTAPATDGPMSEPLTPEQEAQAQAKARACTIKGINAEVDACVANVKQAMAAEAATIKPSPHSRPSSTSGRRPPKPPPWPSGRSSRGASRCRPATLPHRSRPPLDIPPGSAGPSPVLLHSF